MIQSYPELNLKIQDMCEGDEEFRIELTTAIYNGLLELKSKYIEGREKEDLVIIQQIRHKLKPTLIMFAFSDLIVELQNGKAILESNGFGNEFDLHFEKLNSMFDVAVERVFQLTD